MSFKDSLTNKNTPKSKKKNTERRKKLKSNWLNQMRHFFFNLAEQIKSDQNIVNIVQSIQCIQIFINYFTYIIDLSRLCNISTTKLFDLAILVYHFVSKLKTLAVESLYLPFYEKSKSGWNANWSAWAK